MSLFAIDALWINKGTASCSVFEDIAEVVSYDFFRHLHILFFACCLGIIVVGVGIDAGPVVWKGIAEYPALAKPVAVPVTDRNLVETIVWLVTTEILHQGHHVLCTFQVLSVLGLKVHL